MTMPHGPATRGSRRSLGSRSGLSRSPRQRVPVMLVVASSSACLRATRAGSPGRLSNFVDALVLEHLDDVVHVDADGRQRRELWLARRCSTGRTVSPVIATVVGDGLEGLLGHGVDGVRRDQLDDVQGVGVGRVLDAGRRPQRALPVRAARGQRAASGRWRRPPRRPGRPGARWRRRPCRAGARASAVPIFVEALVDLGVDPADEERRDRADRAQVEARGRAPARGRSRKASMTAR